MHAGYHATNSLGLEKAFRHWGHDITDQGTLFEAGLPSAVAFDKPGGFVGHLTSGMCGHTVGAAIGMRHVTTPIGMPRAEVLEAK